MSRPPSRGREQDAPPGFQRLALHASQALADLDALDALLASKTELDERADILPFFGAHPQLARDLRDRLVFARDSGLRP